MRKALRKLALRLAALLADEPAARGVRLQASETPPQLRDPEVPAVGAMAAAVDIWPSVSIGFEWHDAPVKARGGDGGSGGGGVYL